MILPKLILSRIFYLDLFSCKIYHLRDDTHMKSMKIVQFSRTLTPLSIYIQNSSTPLTLYVQFQIKPSISSKWWLPLTPFHVAEASLSAFWWLYTRVCSCPKLSKNIMKCLSFITAHIFSTHFAINLFYLHNLKT